MTDLNDETLLPLLTRLTLAQKVLLLTGRDSWSLHGIPEIGLASMVLSDGPVGVRGATWDERSPSVNFPSPSAVSASWNTDLVREVGEGLGAEARRKGVHVLLAPTINLHRTPYGGRHFEAFSEDPLLTSEIATAYVEGVQSQGVGATVKHYVANDSETDRFTVNVVVDERTLRELYLLAFEGPVVQGPAWLVMSAYNSINGATASENPLLTTPLNSEWGFDGVVVSDWTAVRSIESARQDQDLAMPGPDGAWGDALLAAVDAGEVAESAIDRKVLRLLRLAARVGALVGFEPAAPASTPSADALLQTARAASAAGMVLLANDSVLPLAEPTSIALIGEGAKVARTQGGGSATVIPARVVSPFEGVAERWPDARLDWSLGAVVQSGLADLPIGRFETLEGEPGMTVRYLDATGGVLLSERREASGIVSFDAESLATRSAVVELITRYRPEAAGATTPFAVAGLSDYEVVADGVPVASGQLRTQPGDDPATAVLNPPFAALHVPVAGDAVELTVRFSPVEGGIPDALALRIGVPPLEADADDLIAAAVETARAADVAVVLVSTSAEVESEGFDRSTLRLPGRQDDLVRAVAAANPRTVVVVTAGAPVLLPWRDSVAAVISAWFPGQEFGHALADVLSGDREPAGRLPVTWPATEEAIPVTAVTPVDGVLAYDEGIHIGYKAWLKAATEPAFSFGHGLGYTTWSLDSLAAPARVAVGDELSVSVALTNTGSSTGSTVVQLYLERASESVVDRPVRWLAGFASVTADAGEQVGVTIPLHWRRFAHWDAAWKLEPGSFTLRAGFSSVALVTQAGITA
jgi:beta-glucosidase